VAYGDLCVWTGFPESHAVSRHMALARMGTDSVCHRAGIDVLDLCGHVVAIRSSGLLFSAASGQHRIVYLYLAALHVSRLVERRNYLAGNQVSVGGIEEGDGVAQSESSLLRFCAHVGLIAVRRRAIRGALNRCRLFRRAHSAGAVVALFFHVIILGQRRNQG